MFINANSITVNGIPMGQYLLQAQYDYNKLWGDDTQRNLKGKMSGTLVGIFPKIILTFRKLNNLELAIIAPLLNSASQIVTYYDPELQEMTTMETYTGDWSNVSKNFDKVQSFECSFIAKEARS